MLLTVSLFSKGSFLGSLINKCRQVVRIKTVKQIETNLTKINNSTSLTTISPSTTSTCVPAATTPVTTLKPYPTFNANLSKPSKSIRPSAIANISLSSPTTYAAKTLEEKLGMPPRPKKPLTPYFRFMNEQRPKLQASNPQLTVIDIVKQVSKEWELAEVSLKQKLQEDYKKDQQKYVETRTKYDSKITDEQRSQLKELKQELSEAKEKRMMRKRIKELGRPKKPASAFLKFIGKERVLTPQTANETFREWHQKATIRWSNMTDEQKSVYLMESRKELEKYKKEISVWEEKMIRMGNVDVVRSNNLIDPPEPKPKKH